MKKLGLQAKPSIGLVPPRNKNIFSPAVIEKLIIFCNEGTQPGITTDQARERLGTFFDDIVSAVSRYRAGILRRKLEAPLSDQRADLDALLETISVLLDRLNPVLFPLTAKAVANVIEQRRGRTLGDLISRTHRELDELQKLLSLVKIRFPKGPRATKPNAGPSHQLIHDVIDIIFKYDLPNGKPFLKTILESVGASTKNLDQRVRLASRIK